MIPQFLSWPFLVLMVAGPGRAEPTSIDYQHDVQPLFDYYCVACHACFDAPCQLDLTHPSGVMRGANKLPVYDGTRLDAAQPTRLFVDGHTTADWREKGFFSVTDSDGSASILLSLLDRKRAYPMRPDRPLPDGIELGIRRRHLCVNREEVLAAAADQPHLGMPFALPGMKAHEVGRIRAWLEQGAKVNSDLTAPSAGEREQIERWERWLNDTRPERALVARWLFEHWVIARLYFDQAQTGHFFRLVRSATPPGETVKEIGTRYPNSDPGGAFYYRLRIQTGTRVYKTHITFPLNAERLGRIEQLFFDVDWQAGALPGYTQFERANPFTTFRAIPANARYRFMLENAEYFVRTFIRGPVCRGQLATDVIRDHFWVMFQTPASDPYIVDTAFQRSADRLLVLPGVEHDLLEGAQTWIESKAMRNEYASLRQVAPSLAATEWSGNSVDLGRKRQQQQCTADGVPTPR